MFLTVFGIFSLALLETVLVNRIPFKSELSRPVSARFRSYDRGIGTSTIRKAQTALNSFNRLKVSLVKPLLFPADNQQSIVSTVVQTNTAYMQSKTLEMNYGKSASGISSIQPIAGVPSNHLLFLLTINNLLRLTEFQQRLSGFTCRTRF